jgi:hypothetical protein
MTILRQGSGGSSYPKDSNATRRAGQHAALARRLGLGLVLKYPVGLAAAPAARCQYPEGEAHPYTFCGAPTADHPGGRRSPYCAAHRARCYRGSE